MNTPPYWNDLAADFHALRDERGDVTTHGFRSSFRDWAAESTKRSARRLRGGLSALATRQDGGGHHRTDLFERRRHLMDSWSAFACVTSADVVSMRA